MMNAPGTVDNLLVVLLLFSSILGAILLIGGLYSVLWAKSKETKIEPCSLVNPVESAKVETEQNKPEVHQVDGRGKQEEETSAYTVERV